MNEPVDPRLVQWMRDRNHFAEQNANGVDLSLIRANLKLTPLERLQRNYDQRLATLRMQRHAQRIG
ncbi:MAG: hypothetical protein GC162_02400 [Planctomycetes bacterium]|nr:hypothetical protein [Planctomycetota bacterium]